MHSDTDRTLALAGIFQAAILTRDVARKGICDAEALRSSTYSLFQFDAPGVPEVFRGEQGVAVGLRTLVNQISQPDQRDLEISKYVVAIVHLSGKLEKDGTALKKLSDALVALKLKSTEFDLPMSAKYLQLGAIYQDHISNIGSQIMIQGEPLHLQNPENAARVRTALLAGIRAAMLWRQCGGRKRHLLLQRRRIVTTARQLLDQPPD